MDAVPGRPDRAVANRGCGCDITSSALLKEKLAYRNIGIGGVGREDFVLVKRRRIGMARRRLTIIRTVWRLLRHAAGRGIALGKLFLSFFQVLTDHLCTYLWHWIRLGCNEVFC